MTARTTSLSLILLFASSGLWAADDHGEAMAQSLELFKSEVRGVLVESCVKCHGGEKLQAGFDLTTREGLLAGGEKGVAVLPGNAAESPVLAYIKHRQAPFMPQYEAKLSPEAIAAITTWIDLGAAYDQPLVERTAARAGAMQVTDADRRYWAFAPLAGDFPAGAGVDSFVDAKLQENGLVAAPAAADRTLVRRLYFDLTGLPPSPAEIDAFLADPSPAAYEALVDRLLASPHFGERWARHWLDVARFAESHGFEHDYERPYAFHYRDFVIRAFNQDMPYDRFVRWQLAGDELAPEEPLAMMATGFLCAGVHPTQITVADAERLRYDALDDMLATTGSAMLATTVGCARCHDHKYDPIPARDYYRMLSAFTTTVRSEVSLDLASLEEPPADRQAQRRPLPGPQLASFRQGSGSRTVAATSSREPAPAPNPQRVMVCSEGEHLRPIRLHKSNREIPDFYQQTFYLERGDPRQKDGVAELGFLQVLTRSEEPERRWPARSLDPRTSGRRAALSHWLTDVEAGAGHLAARVIVNRLWQHYFGQGIVATSNNFGAIGDRPTHPLLLDWLAAELIRGGWHLKPIHKRILMSDAYRRGDIASEANAAIDPGNRFLWRRPPRRLEAEAIRDNALAVSGLLDRTLYGAGTLEASSRRRSLYFTVKRSELVPMMQLFDWPDALTSQGQRAVTTTPSQALVFLNDPHMRQLAEGFAARLAGADDAVGEAYMMAYGRPPSASERALGQEFLGEQTASRGGDPQAALADYCGALMSANEFIYIE